MISTIMQISLTCFILLFTMTFINGYNLLQNHLNGDFDELETTFCK